MPEQINIIISILTAILTGGFLMIFIESQKVSSSVTNRLHLALDPFFYSFSNYVKFISIFKSSFIFEVPTNDDFVNRLKENIDTIASLGNQSITYGQYFSADSFKADKLDSICNSINNIWYYFDRYSDYIYKRLYFDSCTAENSGKLITDHLKAISHKYEEVKLNKELLASVSGDFYVDNYQPIQHILHQYELWQQKEKEFKSLAIFTVAVTLMTIILTLLLSVCIPIWVFKLLCVCCCGLLLFEFYKLIKLVDLSKSIMRK